MTPADAVLRVRAIYDENGVTSGFLDNTNDIYKFIDSGHNELITIGILRLRLSRKLKDNQEPAFLTPLIKIDPLNTTTIGATLQEYALPADYIETYRATYDYSGGATALKNCDLMTFDEAYLKQSISLLQADLNNPVYYIRLGKIGFYPQPIGAHANSYEHYYIYKPAEIVSGTSAFILGTECHEAIVKYTAYLSFMKDGEMNLANGFLNQFLELAKSL